MSPSLLRQSARPVLRSARHTRINARFASSSPGSNPQLEAAQKKAQDALASAQQTAGKFLQSAKKYAGPVGEKAGGLLGSYRQPVVYNLSVFRELCKQIYRAEGLSPPSVATVRSAYETMWSKASTREFWQGAVRTGEIAKIGVYAVEAYGIFKIGEILGRRSLVGYNIN
ncbi:hypothetical protein K435DRAFT_748324 [Dendrothele bispora CBS 962.96]|uniref:Mitochondrial F1F0-ATP synthase g subunit n=1 Tax=Dendrothele bispora (strain CBS 962.96) TaxID=1314807 RepID=A0A4S8MK84_DENBC|nr:hypothetical protein K435DRAFT_748324 [Dendrothele bispora CBS 962.96]